MKLTEIEDKLKESENKKKSIESIYETKEKNYKNELMIIKDNKSAVRHVHRPVLDRRVVEKEVLRLPEIDGQRMAAEVKRCRPRTRSVKSVAADEFERGIIREADR